MAHPTDGPPGQVIADRGGWISGPCLDADAVLAALHTRFRGWRFWYGTRTALWWGLPPLWSPHRHLIEANGPDALAWLAAEVEAWGGGL